MYMLMLYDDCHYTFHTPRLRGESMYMSRSSSNYRRVSDYVFSEKITCLQARQSFIKLWLV